MMVLLLGSAMALAHPIEPLIKAVPGTPSLLVQCASMTQFEALVNGRAAGSDRLGDAFAAVTRTELGVDPSAPVTVVVGEDERQRHLGLRVSVQDVAALEGSEALARARDQGVHWAIDDDAVLLFASVPQSADTLMPQKGVESMLPLLDANASGCVALVDLSVVPTSMPWMTGAGLAVWYDPLQPDRLDLRIDGFYAPEQLFVVLEGHKARRAPVGTGPKGPDVVVRLNIELDELLALAPFLPPAVAGSAETFLASGVRVRPGAEIAINQGIEDNPTFVAILNVRRPLRLRKLQEGIEEEFLSRGVSAVWEDEVLRLGEDDKAVYLGVRRRDVIVGTDLDGVRAAVRGEGEPWISADHHAQASEPGFFAEVRKPVRSDVPAPLWLENGGLAVLVSSPTSGAVAVRLEGQGVQALVGSRGDALSPRVPLTPSQAPPAPDDSEAAAVLDLIAVAQNGARKEGGSFVPYAGGPRPVGELDGQRVPWEGIPALGIGPMETACRYEVSLGPDSFTARAICDEDDDGATAIRVVGPSATVERVTPEDVR